MRIIYPIGDYQVGKRLMFEGLTAAASHTFETSYRLSRAYNEQHGIDAVPSLCRNGQALYLSGDLPSALSNLNAGLSLAYATRYWTAYIDTMPVIMRPLELSDGRIAWFAEQRPSRLANYPDSWPVAIGSRALLVETQAPEKTLAVTYETIWIDAIEMFYSQAMAMRVRNNLLGSLAENYQLSLQLESMYADIRSDMPEILQRSQNVCHAIALRGLKGNSPQVRNLLEQNLTLDTGFDHPLTSIALLELAEVAAAMGNIQEAETRAGQASILAARLNQTDVLADSIALLTRLADELSPGRGLAIAENVLRWVDTKFGLAYMTTLVSAMESASKIRNGSAYNAHEKRFVAVAKNTDVLLPHLQAAYYATLVKHSANSGNSGASQRAWQRLVAAATGSDSESPLLSQLVQATSIDIGLRENRISRRTLIAQLARLAERPRRSAWLAQPWQSLVWDNLPLNDLYTVLETDTVPLDNPNKAIQLISDWHERQLRVANPMLHRALAFRSQIRQAVPEGENDQVKELTSFRNRYTGLLTRLDELNRGWLAFRDTVKPESTNWSIEQRRQWSQLLQGSSAQFTDYVIESSAPIAIPGQQSQVLDFEAVQALLKPEQAILGYFHTKDFLWGYVITREKTQAWIVSSPKQVLENQSKLITMIAAYGDYSDMLKSLDRSNDWRRISRELCKSLVPQEVQAQLASVKELKIVPHNELWLMPFGALIKSDAEEDIFWQSQFELSYATTLRSANFSDATLAGSGPRTLFARQNFFTAQNEMDQQLKDSLVQELPAENSTIVTLTKDVVPNYPFQALDSDILLVASEFVLNDFSRTDFVRYREQLLTADSNDSLEINAPEFLFLFGISPQTSAHILQNPSLVQAWLNYHSLLGTRQIIWQQWPVNGESTAVVARELLNRADLPTSNSLRTALLNLWEFQLNSDQEPRFTPPNRSTDAMLLSGKQPVFWGGWKLTTNYPLPTKPLNELVKQN